jgi:hypothetical protein
MDTSVVKNDEISLFLKSQAEVNNQIMQQFMGELQQLRGEVNKTNSHMVNVISKAEELNLITENTL